MKICYMCGIGEDKSFLYQGVGKEGFVFVCRKCLAKNEIPLVTIKDVNPGEMKRETVRERMMAISGVKRDPIEKRKPEIKKDDSLNKIIEKNFKKNLSEKKEHDDLISNFHWVIMRNRRLKKLTLSQFAEKIFEPLVVVEHLEKGILPKDYYSLIRKIESFLGIKLFKDVEVNFDSSTILSETKVPSGVTISDLKKQHEKIKGSFNELNSENLDLEKIEEIVGKPVEEESKEKRNFFGFKKKEKNKENISQDEIEKIVFRS